MQKILLTITFITIFFCSCFYIQDKQIKQSIIAVPPVQDSFQNTGSWPLATWWEEFNEPTLNKLIALSFDCSPSLLSLQSKIEQAKQQAAISRSKLFPYLFFNYNETWEYLSSNGLYKALNPSIASNGNLIDLSLSFSYELDFWSKNRNLLRSALGVMQAEIAEHAQAKLLTAAALAQSFFAYRAADTKQEILEEIIATSLQILSLKDDLLKHALVARIDPLLFSEKVEEYKKQLASLIEQKQLSLHLLCSLSGQGPSSLIFPSFHPLQPLPSQLTIPNDVSIKLLSRRPDLMAQLWRVKALAYEVGAARAAFFPNINLAALAGLESLSFSTLFEAASKTFALEPAITLPLFTAGAIRAGVKAKIAAFDSAVFDYNEKILQSCKEIADTLSLCQRAGQSFRYQKKIVDDASIIYDLVSMRQNAGLDSNIEKWLMKLAKLDKDLALVDIIYSEYLSSIRLIRSLGGGYCNESLSGIYQGEPCES